MSSVGAESFTHAAAHAQLPHDVRDAINLDGAEGTGILACAAGLAVLAIDLCHVAR